ncbi:TraR/DksA C4-type zinc finger protein [Sulfurivirga sp.]|uniref:TraR/DksA C4-type zinc finger protein n=1 Tax=Sulfurivirga sp. TaxID=2614236 RepID=UPI0025D4DCFA|nr:TraR/DksA C4-type zinc finger protein [Sulfurivirga sp.]
MDVIDIANERAQRELDGLLAARRQMARLEAENATAAAECVECGETIPEARRRALPGVRLCIHCAEAAERRARMGV